MTQDEKERYMNNQRGKPMSPLHAIIGALPQDGAVLDVGCIGFGPSHIAQSLGRNDLHQAGIDYVELEPSTLPRAYLFATADLNVGKIPFADDSFNLVVASHVIEHLAQPVQVFGELVRVCKPGGYLYIEAPSERALLLPGFPFAHDSFFSWSFFDDPTHSFRPWTPQSFHRLARYWSCDPLATGYRVSWKHRLALPLTVLYGTITRRPAFLERTVWCALGWASYLVACKPASMAGKPAFHYYIPAQR